MLALRRRAQHRHPPARLLRRRRTSPRYAEAQALPDHPLRPVRLAGEAAAQAGEAAARRARARAPPRAAEPARGAGQRAPVAPARPRPRSGLRGGAARDRRGRAIAADQAADDEASTQRGPGRGDAARRQPPTGASPSWRCRRCSAGCIERPEFEGTTPDGAQRLVEESVKRLARRQGPRRASSRSLRSRLPDHRNRLLAFGLAAAVAFADQRATRTELGLLKTFQAALGISEDEVAQIVDVDRAGQVRSPRRSGSRWSGCYAEVMVLVTAAGREGQRRRGRRPGGELRRGPAVPGRQPGARAVVRERRGHRARHRRACRSGWRCSPTASPPTPSGSRRSAWRRGSRQALGKAVRGGAADAGPACRRPSAWRTTRWSVSAPTAAWRQRPRAPRARLPLGSSALAHRGARPQCGRAPHPRALPPSWAAPTRLVTVPEYVSLHPSRSAAAR